MRVKHFCEALLLITFWLGAEPPYRSDPGAAPVWGCGSPVSDILFIIIHPSVRVHSRLAVRLHVSVCGRASGREEGMMCLRLCATYSDVGFHMCVFLHYTWCCLRELVCVCVHSACCMCFSPSPDICWPCSFSLQIPAFISTHTHTHTGIHTLFPVMSLIQSSMATGIEEVRGEGREGKRRYSFILKGWSWSINSSWCFQVSGSKGGRVLCGRGWGISQRTLCYQVAVSHHSVTHVTNRHVISGLYQWGSWSRKQHCEVSALKMAHNCHHNTHIQSIHAIPLLFFLSLSSLIPSSSLIYSPTSVDFLIVSVWKSLQPVDVWMWTLLFILGNVCVGERQECVSKVRISSG